MTLDGCPMTWTDERVETLKNMWTDGKSASQIAKELGGVTRNAVIGKVHRLGLSNRNGPGDRPEDLELGPEPIEELQPSPVAAADAAEPRTEALAMEDDEEIEEEPAPASVREAVAAARAKPNLVPVSVQPPLVSPASEISPEALANLAEVERKARRISLMQLTERTCKWPVGDPATDDFWFCGLPSVGGKPYCEAHVAVAFQPMSSRRDRRAGGR
jgi:GcrA cell cycle regulator